MATKMKFSIATSKADGLWETSSCSTTMDRFLTKPISKESCINVKKASSTINNSGDLNNNNELDSQRSHECRFPFNLEKVKVNVPKAFGTWKEKYCWLSLNSKGKCICTTCGDAFQKKLPLPKDSRSVNSRKASVDERFDCWKNAIARLTFNERSSLHIAASTGLLNLEKAQCLRENSNSKGPRNT
ncbi:uncharacterized protein LOC117167007 [Belonocnema kinseyi]|uniref:uncharacterized protein LOC117167007 n=1 Tax=Belonocnema kinseyi TaxID=2817044 RepID=UPI00143DA6C6|nr:uncharacterized protein LOC117167007 [Belonocnema kinseyi]